MEAPDDQVESGSKQHREVDRLSGIVDRLLVMAREIEEGITAHVDLRDAIDRAVVRWNERAAARSPRSSPEASGSARVDPTDLDQILDNLLDNADRRIRPGCPGVEQIRTGACSSPCKTEGRVAADELARVTERFYRGLPRAAQGLAS